MDAPCDILVRHIIPDPSHSLLFCILIFLPPVSLWRAPVLYDHQTYANLVFLADELKHLRLHPRLITVNRTRMANYSGNASIVGPPFAASRFPNLVKIDWIMWYVYV